MILDISVYSIIWVSAELLRIYEYSLLKIINEPGGIRTPVPGSEGRKDIQATLRAHD